MKKYFIIIPLLFLVNSAVVIAQQCDLGVVINKNYSKAKAVQAVLDSFTRKDLPGISVAVYSDNEGWWAGASGYARIETKTPMNICHLQYLQSVSKTYMAVVILQLHEQGKIGLDDAITKHLPQKYSQYIKNADQITVRMLLNHTSGIAEYISHPLYTADVILNPRKIIDVEEGLKILKDEEPQFAPGEKYLYTNTNYLLLAIIGNAKLGDHGKYMRERIFKPLQMNHSYYDPKSKKMEYPGLPDSYWDILNSGRPANITPMQKANVAPLEGDDGVVSTPVDAVKFLRGLMEGKLLKDSSMKLMMQWVNNNGGKPAYGLGLIYFDLDGMIGYGHGGGGLGAGCLLLYVPSKKIYIFLSTNTGVVIDGLGGIKANDMKNEVLKALLL